MNISQLSFAMMAGIIFIGFFRYNLLDVLPVARKNIFTELRTSVLVLDANNHLLDLNPAAETLLGICGAKSYGRDIEQLLEHQPEILQVLRKNTSVALPMDFKNRRCHFAIRFSPLTGRRGRSTGRIIIFHDITERKQAQEVIHESERFRGVLEMAGAVCHDLSQPAMAAGGYAEVILSNAPESGPLRESLLKIIEQVEKIGDINKKLLKITQYKAGNG
jgi:PAS domain S-box-containing protein